MARIQESYVAPELSPYNLGWAVGILEGEGTFGAYKTNGNTRYARVVVGSSDRCVVERLQELFGTGRITAPKPRPGREHHKQMYIWTVSRNKAARSIMHLVRSCMSERRQAQIDTALEHAAR